MDNAIQNNALQKEFVPLKSRIWISAADASTAILNGLVTSSAMKYYFTELRGLSLQLEGVVWLLFAIWNAVNDPLFGYISDRTKGKLGRRIPYIRYGAPILVIGFAAFWIDFGSNSQAALFVQMLLALFVFDTLYTAIATSLYIMPYEIAISNKARSSIYIWKIVFMVFTIIVPLAIEATIKPAKGDLSGIRFFEYFLIGFGVLMGLIILFSTFFYKERHQIEEQKFNFVRSFKECFANRSFVVFEVISFTVIFVQTALMQGLWKYFDEINVSRLVVIAPLGLGIILGVLLWIRQRDRWGIKLSTQLFSLLFAIGCFVMLLGGKTVVGAGIASFLFGVGFAGGMYLIPLMNGDVVDMDEHRTGLRREGMYAGINSFITKPAISLAQWAMSTIMLAYGYDQTLQAGQQSDRAETGILMGWVLWPGILLFISFLSLYLYPLAGKEWHQIKEKLAERHQEAEKKYLAEQGIQFEK